VSLRSEQFFNATCSKCLPYEETTLAVLQQKNFYIRTVFDHNFIIKTHVSLKLKQTFMTLDVT